jgi:hypothetical protein
MNREAVYEKRKVTQTPGYTSITCSTISNIAGIYFVSFFASVA